MFEAGSARGVGALGKGWTGRGWAGGRGQKGGGDLKRCSFYPGPMPSVPSSQLRSRVNSWESPKLSVT